mmetsp:Transcript_54381/g.99441  ORF Transcript_54381/g.99441 Transcript_54381/m.99441 type:complete len:447 (+) Transcript_54381:3-1343(+)
MIVENSHPKHDAPGVERSLVSVQKAAPETLPQLVDLSVGDFVCVRDISPSRTNRGRKGNVIQKLGDEVPWKVRFTDERWPRDDWFNAEELEVKSPGARAAAAVPPLQLHQVTDQKKENKEAKAEGKEEKPVSPDQSKAVENTEGAEAPSEEISVGKRILVRNIANTFGTRTNGGRRGEIILKVGNELQWKVRFFDDRWPRNDWFNTEDLELDDSAAVVCSSPLPSPRGTATGVSSYKVTTPRTPRSGSFNAAPAAALATPRTRAGATPSMTPRPTATGSVAAAVAVLTPRSPASRSPASNSFIAKAPSKSPSIPEMSAKQEQELASKKKAEEDVERAAVGEESRKDQQLENRSGRSSSRSQYADLSSVPTAKPVPPEKLSDLMKPIANPVPTSPEDEAMRSSHLKSDSSITTRVPVVRSWRGAGSELASHLSRRLAAVEGANLFSR